MFACVMRFQIPSYSSKSHPLADEADGKDGGHAQKWRDIRVPDETLPHDCFIVESLMFVQTALPDYQRQVAGRQVARAYKIVRVIARHIRLVHSATSVSSRVGNSR